VHHSEIGERIERFPFQLESPLEIRARLRDVARLERQLSEIAGRLRAGGVEAPGSEECVACRLLLMRFEICDAQAMPEIRIHRVETGRAAIEPDRLVPNLQLAIDEAERAQQPGIVSVVLPQPFEEQDGGVVLLVGGQLVGLPHTFG
jgi:hypothetical protein